jgi:hypothetical protein
MAKMHTIKHTDGEPGSAELGILQRMQMLHGGSV